MKGKLLKVSALILAICVLLCGCNKGNVSNQENDTYVTDTNLNQPEEFPICKEPVKMTVGIPKDAHIADYVNNAYTKLLKEKTNETITIVGRHDPAIIRRINIVIRSICAIVIADNLISKYGQDVFLKESL